MCSQPRRGAQCEQTYARSLRTASQELAPRKHTPGFIWSRQVRPPEGKGNDPKLVATASAQFWIIFWCVGEEWGWGGGIWWDIKLPKQQSLDSGMWTYSCLNYVWIYKGTRCHKKQLASHEYVFVLTYSVYSSQNPILQKARLWERRQPKCMQ